MPSLYGYYNQPTMMGSVPMTPGTDYSQYSQGWQDNGYGNSQQGYSPDVAAATAARQYQQPDFNDPFYQRSDIAPIFASQNNRESLMRNGVDTSASSLTKNTYTGQNPWVLPAVALASIVGGAAAAGAGAGAGGAGSGVGMAAGGGQLASDAALGAAADAGVGTFGAGAGAAGAAGAGAAGVGFGGAGTAGLPANLAGDFAAASPYGGAAGQLAASGGISGGAGTAGTGIAGSTWGRLATGAGRQLVSGGNGSGSGGGQQAAPMQVPSIGGFMGSPMASQSYSSPQRMPLNQTTQRSRGYMRTPIQFSGQTIWV